MKSFNLFLLFALISIEASAQADFKFEDFKFRFQKYKGMDFGFSLSDNTSNNEFKATPMKTNNGSLNGTFSYFSFVNSNKRYQVISLSSSLNPSFYSTSLLKESVFYSNVKFNIVSRIYKENAKFYGYEITLNDYYSFTKMKNQNSRNNNESSPSVLFTKGRGRAEYISDGITAIRLFDELKSQNLLTKEVTTENIIEFSKIIIQFNNTRILDNRLNKIAMIEAMVGYLKENGLVEECNAAVFAILNDQVYFATPTNRFCGTVKQWQAGAALTDSRSTLKADTFKSKIFNTNFSPEMLYNITKYTPIDIKNQFNSGLDVGVIYGVSHNYYNNSEQDTTIHSTSKTRQPQFMISAFVERGYYPNTRTALTWNNRITFLASNRAYPVTNETLDMTTTFSSVFSFYYYISPQFRLSVNENLSASNFTRVFTNQFPVNQSHVINTFNAVLTYALF